MLILWTKATIIHRSRMDNHGYLILALEIILQIEASTDFVLVAVIVNLIKIKEA